MMTVEIVRKLTTMSPFGSSATGSAIGEARAETNKDATENPNDPSLSIARTESAHPHIRKRAAKGNCFLTQSCSQIGADRDAEHKHELPA